jgi:hypothetical protein
MENFKEYVQVMDFVTFCEVMKSPLPIPPLSQATVANELEPVMSKGKRKHSLGVGKTISGMGLPPHTQNAAYFHDYIERGGDIQELIGRLQISPQSLKIIQILTAEGDPLQHMMQVLSDPMIDEHTKNMAILIKIADRVDNLNRRLETNNLSPKYLKKSEKLFKNLFQLCSGPPHYIAMLRKRLKDLGIKVKYLFAA